MRQKRDEKRDLSDKLTVASTENDRLKKDIERLQKRADKHR